MRRFLPLISFISTAVMISSACYADTGTTTGSVCVRETPGGGGKVVGYLRKGVTISFSSTAGDGAWVQVDYRGKKGYVARKLLSPVEGGSDSAGMARQEKLGGAAAPLSSTPELETKVITAVSAKSSVFEVTQEPTSEEIRAQYEPRLAQAKAQIAELEGQLAGLQKTSAQAISVCSSGTVAARNNADRLGRELIAAKAMAETQVASLRAAEKAGAEAKIVSGTEYDEPALGLVTVSREPGRVVVAVAASTEGVADARFEGAVRVKQRAGDGRVVYTLDPAKMKAM